MTYKYINSMVILKTQEKKWKTVQNIILKMSNILHKVPNLRIYYTSIIFRHILAKYPFFNYEKISSPLTCLGNPKPSKSKAVNIILFSLLKK